jgi:hypothetical protein
MSVVISDALVLDPRFTTHPNAPLLCWRNLVDSGNIAASSAETMQPVVNLASPSTAFAWQATSNADQTITITVSRDRVDYVGIARHNFGSGTEIRIQTELGGSAATIVDWTAVNPDVQALLYTFPEASPDSIVIGIRNAAEAVRVGVVYVGLATALERNIYVGHTPITYGRNVTEVGGFSEGGEFLGQVVRRETISTQVALQNLSASWYRLELDGFVAQRPRKPAFFSWRPEDYPDEVAYCWISGNPQPSNQRPNGMMQISMTLEGIV